MDVRTCHNCHKKVADQFKKCPFCKKRLVPAAKKAGGQTFWQTIKDEAKAWCEPLYKGLKTWARIVAPKTASDDKKNQNNEPGEGAILYSLLLIVVFILLLSQCNWFSSNSAKVAQEPAMTEAKRLSRDKSMAHLGARNAIKAVLRDPDSYQEIKYAVLVDKTNNNRLAVYLKYRSKNGFGGYVVGDAGFYCRRNTYDCSFATEDQ